MGCASFVLEQRCFNLLAEKNSCSFLSETELKINKNILRELRNYLDIDFILYPIIAKLKPEKFLQIIDGYNPGLPYAKNARSDYSFEQIERLQKPCNIVSLGAGFDCKWINAFLYDPESNRLWHRLSLSDKFEVYLVDNSHDQNKVFAKALKKIFGKLPENVNFRERDLSKKGWSANLLKDESQPVIFQSNGLLPYYTEKQIDNILSEALSVKSCMMLTATLDIESQKAKDIASQSHARKKQETQGKQSETQLHSYENIEELEEFIKGFAEKFSNKLNRLIDHKINFNAEELVEKGQILCQKYPPSKLSDAYKDNNVIPGGEAIISFSITSVKTIKDLQVY